MSLMVKILVSLSGRNVMKPGRHFEGIIANSWFHSSKTRFTVTQKLATVWMASRPTMKHVCKDHSWCKKSGLSRWMMYPNRLAMHKFQLQNEIQMRFSSRNQSISPTK